MKEVSKQEYYNYIKNKGLVYSIEPEYDPYTGYWKDAQGDVYAKRVETYPNGHQYTYVEKHYIKA